MKAMGVVVLLILSVLMVFSLLNWSTLSTSATLSLGLTTVQAPPGLLMLGGAGLLTVSFIAFAVYERTVALLEARRFARELHVQRELADKAEASRFIELRTYLEDELRKSGDRAAAAQAKVDSRLNQLEEQIVAKLAEVENGMSAHVAEVEDKIDRALRTKIA